MWMSIEGRGARDAGLRGDELGLTAPKGGFLSHAGLRLQGAVPWSAPRGKQLHKHPGIWLWTQGQPRTPGLCSHPASLSPLQPSPLSSCFSALGLTWRRCLCHKRRHVGRPLGSSPGGAPGLSSEASQIAAGLQTPGPSLHSYFTLFFAKPFYGAK